jgi:hypothetical protein
MDGMLLGLGKAAFKSAAAGDDFWADNLFGRAKTFSAGRSCEPSD